jgi:hypothetical protein
MSEEIEQTNKIIIHLRFVNEEKKRNVATNDYEEVNR